MHRQSWITTLEERCHSCNQSEPPGDDRSPDTMSTQTDDMLSESPSERHALLEMSLNVVPSLADSGNEPPIQLQAAEVSGVENWHI